MWIILNIHFLIKDSTHFALGGPPMTAGEILAWWFTHPTAGKSKPMTPKKSIIPLLFNYCLFLSHVFDATHTFLLEDIGKLKTNFWSAKKNVTGTPNLGNSPDRGRMGLSKSIGRFLELLRTGALQLYMWLKELITESLGVRVVIAPASWSLHAATLCSLQMKAPGSEGSQATGEKDSPYSEQNWSHFLP